MKKENGLNWRTLDVFNQFSELSDYNLFTTDRALTEALGRCADWSSEQLTIFGVNLGSAGTYALADNANRHKPELQTFDARGRRVDFVDFHPSWHSVLGMYREQGLVSSPFRERRPGRWSAWAAGFYASFIRSAFLPRARG